MFMRVAVPEFGAFDGCCAPGWLCLIMLVIVTAFRQTLRRSALETYLAVGAVNTAIPFIAYSRRAAHPGWLQRDCQPTTPVWSAR